MIKRTKQIAFVVGVTFIAAFSLKSGVEAGQHGQHDHSHAPASAKKIKNALKATEENIAAGKTLYANKCATCHGEDGKANSSSASKMKVKPADLTSLRERTDGEIYWVITNGIQKSGMPAMKTASAQNRWELTLYVKHLMGEHPHGGEKVSTTAQHENHGQQRPLAQASQQDNKQFDMQHSSMNISKMIENGHNVLAIAYMQNVVAFARTLKDRVDSAKSVDADFARAAVAEMRRSFDTMQQHMTEHKRSLPAEMQSQAGMQSHAGMQSPSGAQPAPGTQSKAAMMQGEYQHLLELRQTLELLEREVDSSAPRVNKISERAAAIIKHIEMMAMSAGEHKDHKM